MAEVGKSKFWLDLITADIIKQYPTGEIIVSSGHSPSGRYHFGLFREFMTAHAITVKLQERGRQATHIDFVDDFDALRKVPVGLDPSYEQYLGWPLYLVPSPDGKVPSYADYYLNELYQAVNEAGIKPKVIRAHEEYGAGKFTNAIEASLEKTDQAKSIIQKVSGRALPKEWAPVQILSDNNSLREWSFTGWDRAATTIEYVDQAGKKGHINYKKEPHRAKLDWRLDWPARWYLYGVKVEPFGRDHATKGGSYDTGRELVKQVFNSQPPYPVPYDFILLSGQSKKMSKSAGNIITLGEILQVLPAELMRYLIAKSKPTKPISFDTGRGLYNLLEEYSKVEEAELNKEVHPYADAYHLAVSGNLMKTISSIPFNHLVASYQTGRGNFGEVTAILGRTGYHETVKREAAIIKRELGYVGRWLDKFAPEEVKFSVQEQLPKLELSKEQKSFLVALADVINRQKELNAQTVHESVYKLAEASRVAPADAFKTIYRIILGKDSGPKVGWFLSSLDRDWLVKRLKLEA